MEETTGYEDNDSLAEMSYVEWQANQYVIKSHNATTVANIKLDKIVKVLELYYEGMILSTEATEAIENIIKNKR